MKSPTALLAFALLLPLGGCPLLQIEAEVPQVCIARTGVTVPGSLGELLTMVKIGLDDAGGLDELRGGDALRFVSFAATPQGGGQELAGVQSARITLLASADSGLPPVQLFACADSCTGEDGALTLTSSSDANIAAYLRDREVAVELELRGSLPLQDFKVDLDACLSGEVRRSIDP